MSQKQPDIEMTIKCLMVIVADYIVLRKELAAMSFTQEMREGHERGEQLGREAWAMAQAALKAKGQRE